MGALIVIAGCASLSEDACRGGDWYGIGLKDGAAGRDANHLSNHAEACADYGITPVRATWETGRQEGLTLYCRPRRAWEEGSNGRRLRPVCPLEDRAALLRANDLGLTYADIGRDIRDDERRIHDIDSMLRDLPDGDMARAGLVRERAALRLAILRLRARQHRYRY